MKSFIKSEKLVVFKNETVTVNAFFAHGVLSLKNTKHMPVRSIFRQKFIICLLFILSIAGMQKVSAIDKTSYVSEKKGNGYFALAESGNPAPLFISNDDYPGVIRALKDLQADIKRVTDKEPGLSIDKLPASKNIVLVGTLGKSPIIDKLVKEKKLDISDIAGKWETFLLQVVDNPLPGVDHALVITGSDKRGTIYGIYDLSSQIGVSPWYWWADVPVVHKSDLYVMPGHHTQGEPAVKYRGIFINDEAPALSGWVHEKFGNFNHQFYEKVFELILRLKGNYLWPAMWGNAFNDDDTLNPVLANEYGIVMGTSHHEPMMRSQQEWKRYGNGPWNYQTNSDTLNKFWKQGIINMDSHESIVTIGMRGDGDMPMSDTSNIALLEKIVADQRKIIEEVTGKPASETPQDWALYKEVQDYYDKGMRVPDDVTLLFSDDNWGNIRRLPDLNAKPRKGGYGIYYHFDYVGGPRNYKWLNTNQIERVWEQMHLAYKYNAKRIWIVNVGDIKPMEFPISFFLDYAWNPDKWTADELPDYYKRWTEQQFGNHYTGEIAEILAKYTKYNSRRKPELLSPQTYSLTNYREAETVVKDYYNLTSKSEKIYEALPSEYKSAFYQLVLYPVEACANLNDLYVTAGKNHLYAKEGRAITNDLDDSVKVLFDRDAEYSHYYNKINANGKWDHFMDQTHIGYTYWQQPLQNNMPKVEKINLPDAADMGVAIQCSGDWWPMDPEKAVLPVFDPFNKQAYYIDVFNRGKEPFEYTVKAEKPWIIFTPQQGKVEKQQRLWVKIDWQKAPVGKHQVPITISGPDSKNVVIEVVIDNPAMSVQKEMKGFIESNGYVSMEAAHYTRAVDKAPFKWQVIPNLGRTLSAVEALPVAIESQTPGGTSPHLEFQVYLSDTGNVQVRAYLSPTLNFHNTKGGLRYGISFDNNPPQIIHIHEDESGRAWEKMVSDNINIKISGHHIDKPGEHVLKFWLVDPGIVLQKLVIDTGHLKPSYLGPPESFIAE